MASSGVAGDDAYPTEMPSRDVSLRPVIEVLPPFLRFAVGQLPEEFPLADAPAFISSIDDALARYADEQLVQIEISLVFRPGQFYIARLGKYDKEHPHAALIKAHHVRSWLRYGMARAEESFVLEVPPCPPEEEHEGLALDLPASAAAVTMALTLGNATLTLPAAPAEASFRNLMDLLLGNVRIVDGDRLGELLSSPSCPRLKRLRLEYLMGAAELVLRVDELEELTIVSARDLQCLVVKAERLRTLCVTDCSSLESDDKGELVIYAPALEALTCSNMCKFRSLLFHAPSVREIGKLPLWTHGHANQAGRNQASIWIIKHCAAARRLNLHLHVPRFMSEFLVDYGNILVEKIPKLPNITALTVTISAWSGHSYAASLARLIAQCVNLEELHIDVNRDYPKPTCSDQGCICNNEGGWENQKFSLERLRYLDITGVQGLDYEKRLVQMILEGAPAIEKSKLPPPLEMGLILDIPSC